MTEQEDTTSKPKTDPIVDAILATLRDLEPGKSASPMDVARAYAAARAKPGDGPQAWRRYMNAVKQQMVHLARARRIEIIRKGQPVDPNNFKGVVRLRMPESE
ncbi:MAG: DUF3253 domain-containing protein [Alphaproteobacteria bacterium]|nr:DUF3253 domain-containing protein [Alphaproteobacteria bacterium]